MRDWVRAMQESEIKHMQDTYGPDAEIPKAQTPYGQLTNTIPVTKTAPARIAELAQELTGAAHMLAEAREERARATRNLAKCEEAFIRVGDALTTAIQEHREGTPEGVPYPR